MTKTTTENKIASILWLTNCRLQRLTEKRNCFITCSGKTDGAGAQIQAALSTMLLAKAMNMRYVHTPFRTMIAHRPEERNDEFVKRWESFANLGVNELNIGEIDTIKVDVVYLEHPRGIRKKENTLYVLPDCHALADRCPNLYSNVLEDSF